MTSPGEVSRSLTEAVEVMDQLRSAGGCPWIQEQTHESLLQYLLEESYELVDAVETGTQAEIREELGDVLLQVLFHARIGAEHPDEPFDIVDVADTLVAKLKRRHPHVFSEGEANKLKVSDAAEVAANWTKIKAAERAARADSAETAERAENTRENSLLDGISRSQGALALAQQVVHRAGPELAASREAAGCDTASHEDESAARVLGEKILALVVSAEANGINAEAALRSAVRRLATELLTQPGNQATVR